MNHMELQRRPRIAISIARMSLALVMTASVGCDQNSSSPEETSSSRENKSVKRNKSVSSIPSTTSTQKECNFKANFPFTAFRELCPMIRIPSTTDFVVGSAQFPPMREIARIDAFLISPCEVTQGLYNTVVGGNPSVNKDGTNYPVENVSWFDAVKFCNKLSEALNLTPCYDEAREFKCDYTRSGFRLPKSAEWEFACRGSSVTPYFWGSRKNDTYCVPPIKPSRFRKLTNPLLVSPTSPVMSRQANARGLYDLAGNVAEWCDDTWGDRPGRRTIRGGSWENVDWKAFQTKWSTGMLEENYGPTVGFRLVRRAE